MSVPPPPRSPILSLSLCSPVPVSLRPHAASFVPNSPSFPPSATTSLLRHPQSHAFFLIFSLVNPLLQFEAVVSDPGGRANALTAPWAMQDCFYKDLTAEQADNISDYNFDHPDAFDFSEIYSSLQVSP